MRCPIWLITFAALAITGCGQPANKTDNESPKADIHGPQTTDPNHPPAPKKELPPAPKIGVPEEPKKEAPVEDLTRVEPAFKMTAEELNRECKGDREEVDKKFLGKVVEVRGRVTSIERTDKGEPHLDLGPVSIYPTDPSPWSKVAKGQEIRIKGRVDLTLFPTLRNCVFVETGEYAAAVVTATALAMEDAIDPDATDKKYRDKSILVSGQVVSKETSNLGITTVVLKSDNKIKVECAFPSTEKDSMKRIEVGRQIKVFAERLYTNRGDGNTVSLGSCKLLIEP